jgi:general secretion pathway protein K
MMRADPRRGVVLVTVLWSIVLLSALAMAASVTFRAFAGIAAVARDRVQGEALLTAGVEAVAGIVASVKDIPLAETETSLTLPVGSVRARFSDAGGRIDVGKAPVEVLASLLRAIGAPDAGAAQVAGAIIQLRTRPDTAVLEGAAQAPDRRAKKPDLDQVFTDVRQLAQIPGMAPQWLEAIVPLTTVFGSETVNPLTAPAEVIAALPGVDQARLNAFLDMRRIHPADADRVVALLGAAQAYVKVSAQQVVSIDLTARLADGYATAAHAIIVTLPGDSQPYRILVWTPSTDIRL